MSPYDPALLEVSDYLPIAVDIRPLVAGTRETGYHAKVVGTDPETGSQVTVARWPLEYEKKAEADKRSRQMFADVKRRRTATLLMERMREGLIKLDPKTGEYVGIASDGTEVIMGRAGEEEQLERYLRSNPHPSTW
jgi:hypothetical protein